MVHDENLPSSTRHTSIRNSKRAAGEGGTRADIDEGTNGGRGRSEDEMNFSLNMMIELVRNLGRFRRKRILD